ncbi:MAG: FAD-dependent oxidoreductase [Planctomycetota bacterium]|nr:FAD-dependent oxidoreductase [Planctomycetota bacterium]MDA1179438.1 FAD-dependent oxidoreductase [Planctomycetota bacterium]
MPYRLTNLRLPVEIPESELPTAIASALRVPVESLASCRVLRKSLDARHRHDLQFVYSTVIDFFGGKIPSHIRKYDNLTPFSPTPFFEPEPGQTPLDQRPVIVGSGPAGLLAGYYLAQKGYCPLIVERGEAVKSRVPANRGFDRGGEFDTENNYLFGEGGAGCFSDGKLTCRITGPDVDWVLQRFVECGGRPSLIYEQRPHLGSNKLPLICRNFRRKIEAMGGEYRFGCRMEGIDIHEDRVRGIMTSQGYIPTSQLILAIGHSARDTYQMLHAAGLPLEQKAFQLGLRIEQPQQQINDFKYGRPAYLELLGAADYSIVHQTPGRRDVFTFCMCAGGIVMPSMSEVGHFCTNGMSNSRHDTPFANSGIVATIQPDEFGSEHPLAGIELQRRYEAAAYALAGSNYLAPIQSVEDFLADRNPASNAKLPSSYQRGTHPLNLSHVLPPVITNAIRESLPAMDRNWNGRYLQNATLVGPEMRGSSPVRIPRDRETWQSPTLAGLYPVGEGAGFAGGIVTAAVDGLRAARKLVENYAPLAPATQLALT